MKEVYEKVKKNLSANSTLSPTSCICGQKHPQTQLPVCRDVEVVPVEEGVGLVPGEDVSPAVARVETPLCKVDPGEDGGIGGSVVHERVAVFTIVVLLKMSLEVVGLLGRQLNRFLLPTICGASDAGFRAAR